jgi:hypothetical protein
MKNADLTGLKKHWRDKGELKESLAVLSFNLILSFNFHCSDFLLPSFALFLKDRTGNRALSSESDWDLKNTAGATVI